jgi:folate-binding protein YgfZ
MTRKISRDYKAKKTLMLNYQIITFEGDNATTFLQGQLTADITKLTEENFLLTAYCNPQGRMWCIGRIWRDAKSFYLLIPSEIAADIAADLNKYAAFSKVKLSVNTDYNVIPVQANNNLPSEIKFLSINKQRGLIISPKELKTQPLNELTAEEWELAEIRDGIPNVWKQTLAQLLPHDVNLPELHGVAFDKGCYKGQEIIARMQYRGQRKKHLYYAICPASAAIQPGDKILNEEQKNMGEIVSAALNTENQYEFLAILPDTIVEQHSVLSVNGNVIPHACVEIKLPHE